MNPLKEISRRLSGVFDTIELSDEPMVADIYSSFRELEYHGIEQDKANIRGDIERLGRDFKKSARDAGTKLAYGETSSSK